MTKKIDGAGATIMGLDCAIRCRNNPDTSVYDDREILFMLVSEFFAKLLLIFNYHSLRHTHTTLLIESGANIKNVQTRLGHTNIETTLKTYVHDTKKIANQSVNLFEKITQTKIS